MHNFGEKCWSYIEKNNQGKIASKATECIFLGYTEGSTIYRLWDFKNRKLIQSIDVEFYKLDKDKSDIDISQVYVEEDNSKTAKPEIAEDQESETDESKKMIQEPEQLPARPKQKAAEKVRE